MLERRAFLQSSLAALSALQFACASQNGGTASTHSESIGGFNHTPFALGVASGSPSTDGMVLWTRLMGWSNQQREALELSHGKASIHVHWQVAHDEAFARIAQQGSATALVELGHSVHVEVSGLEAGREYFYRFLLPQNTGKASLASPTGRTRTLPTLASLPNRLRLAYASCQRWEHGYYSAYEHMLREEADLVLFLGDYIYEYAGAVNAVRSVTGGTVKTLADYRQRYALHRSDPALQAMHAACPWLIIWDDHEVVNDYFGTDPDVRERKAAAYQAFYEHMPLRRRTLQTALASLSQGFSQGHELRIYGHLTWGQLANIHLLDDRQYRDPQACNAAGKKGSSVFYANNCADWLDPKRSLLGARQEQWLYEQLKNQGDQQAGKANKGWTLLAQQSIFGPRRTNTTRGQQVWNDSWDGYPAARERLLRSLQNSASPNPVFLGGDIHENWVGHVHSDYDKPNSPKLGVEFCGTSLTSRSGIADRASQLLRDNPHFVHGDGQQRGYGIAEFTPQKLTVHLRLVDDVTQVKTQLSTQASFHVTAGTAQIERA